MPHAIRATDLTALLTCDRQVYLNYHGDRSQAVEPSAYQRLLREQGLSFEQTVIVTLAPQRVPAMPEDLDGAFRQTVELMQHGVAAIYQGVLIDGDLIGVPDLLERVDGPSRWGVYHYRAVDVKAAKDTKPAYELQVMFYGRLLAAVQGVPGQGALLLRDDAPDAPQPFREVPVPPEDERFAAALAALTDLAAGREPRPFISSACGDCPWREVCLPIAEAAGDVSLVTGLARTVWEQMYANGLGTLAAAAGAAVADLTPLHRVGEKTAQHIIRQAAALAEDRPVAIAPPGLPAPADGEIFFDVESYAHATGTDYYLMGLLIHEGGGYRFAYDLAEHPADERAMWEAFLVRISHSSGPVYHYGVYEATTIRELMARYGADPRAAALLGRLVDLQKTLRASVTLPVRGYSLKQVGRWMGYIWRGVTQSAGDSVVDYHNWLQSGDRAYLDAILTYNEDDVRATLAVRDWLLGWRDTSGR